MLKPQYLCTLAFFVFLPACKVVARTAASDDAEAVQEAEEAEETKGVADAKAAAEKAEKKAKQARTKAKNRVRALTAELDENEHKMHTARLSLELALSKGEAEVHEAELKVESAKFELESARMAFEKFVEHEEPLRRARLDLQLERSAHEVEEARQNLAGMIEIYDDEVEARSKEEILLRSRRRLEFAEREYDLTQQSAAITRDFTLAKERRDLEQAVAKTEAALGAAERALGRSRLSAEINRMEKSWGRVEAEKAFADTEKKLSKAKQDAGQS